MQSVRRSIPMSIRDRARKATVPVAAMILIVSSCLWVWTSGIYYRPLPKPACAVRVPFVLFQARASDDGVHFLAMNQHASQFPAIQVGRATSLGNAGYHHGCVVNILGLVIAVLPTTYNGGDYFVSPHVALVLPYWLLIVGAGCLLIVRTPAATWITTRCRWSKVSVGAAVLVCLVFALLNFIPSAWRPGAAIQPETFLDWVILTIVPHAAYSEIMLVYGFPFPCYRNGMMNGKSVDLFYGADVGWEPHKAMENTCVAAFAAFAVMLPIEWFRHRMA